MMKNLITSLLLLFANLLIGLEKRDQFQPMKVSIIIPCHSNHFVLLQDLLRRYRIQSVPPDEIVISLSNIGEVDPRHLHILEKTSWPFQLKILKHQYQLEAGINRNLACAASEGDLLICQDADDFPHRQRVQIIKYLFENYKIDFLMHKFVFDEAEFSRCNLQDMAAACDCMRGIDEQKLIYITQGCPALTRNVFQKVQWEKRNGGPFEDGVFNGKVFSLFENSYLLSIPLLLYRSHLSAWDK
jgi:hypothetical protein